jgi:hypothetical protein
MDYITIDARSRFGQVGQAAVEQSLQLQVRRRTSHFVQLGYLPVHFGKPLLVIELLQHGAVDCLARGLAQCFAQA